MVGEHEVNAEVEKKQKFKSKHSGKTLEKLKIHFQVYNRRKVPETIFSKDDNREWAVTHSSYYYTEGNPVIRYIFEIEEVEELNIIDLQFNGLSLKPYDYYEEIDGVKGDSLIIKGRANLSFDLWKKIEDLYNKYGYFEVLRRGISLDKKKMRFERIIWSKDEKGVNCAFSLYEYVYDTFKLYSPVKPEIEMIKKDSIENDNQINYLMELLREKNILDDEDIENIIISKKKNINTLKFGEVENLEDFLSVYKI
jgi:hypothetical protein